MRHAMMCGLEMMVLTKKEMGGAKEVKHFNGSE